MNEIEHRKYLEEFEKYSRKVLASKKSSEKFLVKTGITTKSGRLSTKYYHVPLEATK